MEGPILVNSPSSFPQRTHRRSEIRGYIRRMRCHTWLRAVELLFCSAMAVTSSSVYEGDVIFLYCKEARGYVYSDPPRYGITEGLLISVQQLYNEYNTEVLFRSFLTFGNTPSSSRFSHVTVFTPEASAPPEDPGFPNVHCQYPCLHACKLECQIRAYKCKRATPLYMQTCTYAVGLHAYHQFACILSSFCLYLMLYYYLC